MLDTLPQELLLIILSQLIARHFTRAYSTCRRIHEDVSLQAIWSRFRYPCQHLVVGSINLVDSQRNIFNGNNMTDFQTIINRAGEWGNDMWLKMHQWLQMKDTSGAEYDLKYNFTFHTIDEVKHKLNRTEYCLSKDSELESAEVLFEQCLNRPLDHRHPYQFNYRMYVVECAPYILVNESMTPMNTKLWLLYKRGGDSGDDDWEFLSSMYIFEDQTTPAANDKNKNELHCLDALSSTMIERYTHVNAMTTRSVVKATRDGRLLAPMYIIYVYMWYMWKNKPEMCISGSYPTIGEWFHMSEEKRRERKDIIERIIKVYKDMDRSAKATESYNMMMKMFRSYHLACELKQQMTDAQTTSDDETYNAVREEFSQVKLQIRKSQQKLEAMMGNGTLMAV